MKRILLAGAAIVALTVAQPAVAQPINWFGWYFGGNIGGAWGSSNTDSPLTNIGGGQQYIPSVVADINAQRFQTLNLTSPIFGVQAGFNTPPSPWFVGFEVDFNSLHLSGTSVVSAFFTGFPGPGGTPPTYTNSVSTNWLFTARLRAGIASGNWLFYGTIGPAVTDLSYTHTFVEGIFPGSSSGTQVSTASANKLGYVVGAGLEYAWPGTHWSVKAEYLHIDFGSVTSTAPVVFPGGPGTSIFTHTANLKVNIARVGLNFAFNTH